MPKNLRTQVSVFVAKLMVLTLPHASRPCQVTTRVYWFHPKGCNYDTVLGLNCGMIENLPGLFPMIAYCVHFRDPIYWHGLTLIPARTSNHMPSKMGDEIAYPFPNFNGCTVGGGGGGLLACKQIYETCGFVWYIYCAAITHKEPPLSNPGSRILH